MQGGEVAVGAVFVRRELRGVVVERAPVVVVVRAGGRWSRIIAIAIAIIVKGCVYVVQALGGRQVYRVEECANVVVVLRGGGSC